jgi:hypothetical protein
MNTRLACGGLIWLMAATACGGGGDTPPEPTRTIQRIVNGHGTVTLHDGFDKVTLGNDTFTCDMDHCEETPGFDIATGKVSFGVAPGAGYHFVSAFLDTTELDTSVLLFSQTQVYVLTVTFEPDAGNPGCKVQDPVGPAEAVGGSCRGFAFDGNPKPSTIICDLELDARISPNLARVEFHENAMDQTPGVSTFSGNYVTCDPCLVIFPEQTGQAPAPAQGDTYVGQDGTLELFPAGPGRVRGHVHGVHVVHSLIDPVTFIAAPDPDGCESDVWDLDFDAELVVEQM